MSPDLQQAAIRVSGERAIFPRSEFRRDTVTYDILTPTAARGIMDKIHWRPAIKWVIDAIHILKPLNFETGFVAGRRSIMLRDVSYVVEAHFVLTGRAGTQDEPARHAGMFRRQVHRADDVYLGDETFISATKPSRLKLNC